MIVVLVLTFIILHSGMSGNVGKVRVPEVAVSEVRTEGGKNKPPSLAKLWTEEEVGCSTDLKGLIARVHVNNTVIWTVGNFGFKEMVLNLVESIRRVGLTNYIVVALEPKMGRYLSDRNIPCYIRSEDLQDATDLDDFHGYASPKYLKIVHMKPSLALEVIETGYNQVFADSDLVFTRDFMAYLEDQRRSGELEKWDYILQDDTYQPCTGFFWIRACDDTRTFFTELLPYLRTRTGNNDQVGNAELLNKWRQEQRRLRWKMFGLSEFPNGSIYHWRGDRKNPFIVHYNFIVGRITKVWRMREDGFWLIDDAAYYTSPDFNSLSVSRTPDVATVARPTADKMKYVSVNIRGVKSADEYFDVLRNGMAIAAHLKRAFVVPQFPCDFCWICSNKRRLCDISYFEPPIGNKPKLTQIDRQFPVVEAFVALRHEGILKDPLFIENYPTFVNVIISDPSSSDAVPGSTLNSISNGPNLDKLYSLPSNDFELKIPSDKAECGLNSGEMMDALRSVLDQPHLHFSSSLMFRYTGESTDKLDSVIDKTFPAKIREEGAGKCSWA